MTDDYVTPFAWNGVLHEVVVDTSPTAVPADPTLAERIEIHRE